MPRKSAAELATAPVLLVIPRPAAPADLTPDEAAVWAAVTGCVKADFFNSAMFGELSNYCRHTVSVRQISLWVTEMIDGKSDGEIADLDRLLKMRERETRAASSLATGLRITKQSTISPKGAGGQLAIEGPKPWETK